MEVTRSWGWGEPRECHLCPTKAPREFPAPCSRVHHVSPQTAWDSEAGPPPTRWQPVLTLPASRTVSNEGLSHTRHPVCSALFQRPERPQTVLPNRGFCQPGTPGQRANPLPPIDTRPSSGWPSDPHLLSPSPHPRHSAQSSQGSDGRRGTLSDGAYKTSPLEGPLLAIGAQGTHIRSASPGEATTPDIGISVSSRATPAPLLPVGVILFFPCSGGRAEAGGALLSAGPRS